MSEGGTDLRICTSRDSHQESAFEGGRGTKRKLEISIEAQDGSENKRIERTSAPKRRRRSREGLVGKVKKNISDIFQCKYPAVKNIERMLNLLV